MPAPNAERLARLTPRELQVLAELAALGYTKAVAGKLKLSERTVEHHLESIRKKLECDSTLQAVALFVQTNSSSTAPSETRTPNPETRPKRLAWVFGLSSLVFGTVLGLQIVNRKSQIVNPLADADLEITTIDEDFRFGVLGEEWTKYVGIGKVEVNPKTRSMIYALDKSTDSATPAQLTTVTREFPGTHWVLNAKITYRLPEGQGRQLCFGVAFDRDPFKPIAEFEIRRHRDKGRPACFITDIVEGGFGANAYRPQPQDPCTVWLRIVRRGQLVDSYVGLNERDFEEFVGYPFRQPLPNSQRIVISGRTFRDVTDPLYRDQAGSMEIHSVKVDPLPDSNP